MLTCFGKHRGTLRERRMQTTECTVMLRRGGNTRDRVTTRDTTGFTGCARCTNGTDWGRATCLRMVRCVRIAVRSCCGVGKQTIPCFAQGRGADETRWWVNELGTSGGNAWRASLWHRGGRDGARGRTRALTVSISFSISLLVRLLFVFRRGSDITIQIDTVTASVAVFLQPSRTSLVHTISALHKSMQLHYAHVCVLDDRLLCC